MNNFDIAVLTAINELADRYQIPPSAFIAESRTSAAGYCVEFQVGPRDPELRERLDRMLDSLGVEQDGTLAGEEGEIWDALCTAGKLAPHRRLSR